jgi:glycosyltransferase involved in cell wall biosynthesis
MQKIACIFSFQESNWVSCQKIVFNLHKSYQACQAVELSNFNFPHKHGTQSSLDKLAQDIFNYAPDVLAIIDHKPHPIILFQSLNSLYAGAKKPKIIFHLFGDFTIFYAQWEKLGPLLEGYPVEFVVASERQKILIDKMFLDNSCTICPFPVDPKDFYPDQALRKKQRQDWNLADEDVAFLFTGRLSRQKRIKTLITSFASEFKDDSRAHLFLYGNQDNIGDLFLGIADLEGEYFRVFYNAYKALPQVIQKRIHFMGQVPNSELLKVYQGADIFINLSVHNDEDYGMSVAEAQFVGLPVGLTDWGGLASFHHADLPDSTSFIPVKIGKRSKQVSIAGAKHTMRNFYLNPQTQMREAISIVANNKFGLSKATMMIEEILSKDSAHFKGFTPLFNRAALASSMSSLSPMYIKSDLTLNQLYRDIYSSYVKNP